MFVAHRYISIHNLFAECDKNIYFLKYYLCLCNRSYFEIRWKEQSKKQQENRRWTIDRITIDRITIDRITIDRI